MHARTRGAWRFRTAIYAIARDEGRYIAEWIALHRAIGFVHVFLYNNDSGDDTMAVAARWPDFVTAISWPDRPGVKAQHTAYRHFLGEHATSAEWVMALDCDEMVCLKQHDTIGAFLDGYPDEAAIGINWRLFGDNGHADYSPGLTMERFTMASTEDFGANRIIKTIARSEAIANFGIHCPVLREGCSLVSPSRRPLRQPPAVRQEATEHDIISVNHYFTKSRGEWNQKRMRGMADMPPGHPARIRGDVDFSHNNRNDVSETSILRFLSKVHAELAQCDTLAIAP